MVLVIDHKILVYEANVKMNLLSILICSYEIVPLCAVMWMITPQLYQCKLGLFQSLL